ncbi:MULTISPECIES: DNA internalization-related competence protein ComEC/Rec2 [Streptococcus]|uniref:DNA internalization-related competence protein ComEC/Rec2 n=1 Tax=Streptococcus TaxID=1301 RepID=UPI0007765C40|nr:DNA internalization-related competence protein ComEC/Rec2 [Streptococcus lutetiensis]MBT0943586.1 DNA internalization-related competence protein ComEC/Rec2 [Streptococcus lutetiensis]MDU2674646.1 DNA internalization-related competence protein ComEC/Rec2 [Streptococcus lutetiensis]MEE0355271.1 DNA internalization-related competence protein ComEC/Rec2 [Streptococcus lutetiensis]
MLIKHFPVKPIQLAFLLILLYYFCFSKGIGCLMFLLLALLFLWQQYGWKAWYQVSLCLAFFAIFFLTKANQTEQASQAAPTQLAKIQMIPDTISVNGDLLSFRGKEAGQTYQVFYILKSEKEQEFFKNLNQTMLLSGQVDLEEATPQRNFGGFDYRTYLKHEGIYRIANLSSITEIRQQSSLSFFERLHELRRQAIVSIQRNFPAPMQHYMTGLLFGYLDKSFDEMSDVYTSLGIIHLFALSGMQVGFFVALFRFIILRLGLRRDYVDILQIPFSLVYAGLTGFSVSVIRSLIQSAFANLGIKKLDNLAFTLMTLFILMPNFLLTTGGILSFTYAFILSFIDFDELSHYQKILTECFAISLGSLPVLLYFFSVFQPLSLLLTAIFSLAFDTLILPVLTFVFLLSPLVKITALNPFFVFLETIIKFSKSLIGTPLVFGRPSLGILLLLLLIIGLLYDCYRHKKVAIFLFSIIALLFFQIKHPLENEVTVVDIGQGDSILVRDVKGQTLLIDVGGKVRFSEKKSWQKRLADSNAERTLIPYLKSRGIGKIDQLVLTHTDTDHMGDMLEVAKELKIGQVLVSPGSLTKPDFVVKLRQMKTPVHAVSAGDNLPIMGSHLQVLYPNAVGDGGNNDSVVLYGNLLGKNFLFTGDLEEEGEEQMMATYPNLPVDVLKAGHHGSKGSSSPEFLDHISPQMALISAGQNNRYKHPHQETLDRFQNQNMTIYRTDQQGAIRFRGLNHWKIETVR